MASPWQQLIRSQITLEEALELLVDPQGIVNLDLLDLEVSCRFRRCFPKGDNLPPVMPLLLWQNRNYLGSTAELSKEKIRKLGMRTRTEIEVIPICQKLVF